LGALLLVDSFVDARTSPGAVHTAGTGRDHARRRDANPISSIAGMALPPLPRLAVAREQARAPIAERISQGEGLLHLQIVREDDLQHAREAFENWDDYNTTLLRKLFTGDEVASQYAPRPMEYISLAFTATYTIRTRADRLFAAIRTKLQELRRLLDQLPLYQEAFVPSDASEPSVATRASQPGSSRDVFIVHGRDHALKEAAARLVSLLGYNPIILHERAHGGRTLLEKLIDESDQAAFAVVLLTPDDKGALAESSSPMAPRARQNVVFEFGYFAGRLGRGCVVALLPDNAIERPTDIDGVGYIPVTNLADQTWRLQLAREMRAAGLDIDLNVL
jgi:predicted nucleotide-binding protein